MGRFFLLKSKVNFVRRSFSEGGKSKFKSELSGYIFWN